MLNNKSVIGLLILGAMISSLSAANMSSEVVYTKTCALCHGTAGEGNPDIPDAPALNGLSEEELTIKLSEVKGAGFDSYHEKMEKNQKIIELRGMKYDSAEMAKYIYTNFNEDSD